MKYPITVLLLTLSLYGIDFETFKARIMRDSPLLQSLRLKEKIVQQRGEITLLRQNPSLEIEGNRLDEKNGAHGDTGWRIGYTQPMRVPGLFSNLKKSTTAKIHTQRLEIRRSFAAFSARLERLYTEYVYTAKRTELAQKEVQIASRLEKITRSRLKSGFTSRAKLMQIALERREARYRALLWKQKSENAYFNLLSHAGVEHNVTLQKRFLYDPATPPLPTSLQNPDLLAKKSRTKALKLEAASYDYRIRSWNLFGEYEDESDQRIARLGVAIDLPFSGQNQERAKLLRIEAKANELRTEAFEKRQRIRLRALESRVKHLRERYRFIRSLIRDQKRLLRLFEEGYRLSGGELLDLISAKNRLIAHKTTLLDLQRESNIQIIEQNYLEGKYYE
ncbi:MAG: hypothetical protein B6D59_00545 [Campylobacteraceae bacterium 4484_4]|nr:MAG: hypothetical protein B6D59_00545 [Campylobacteraceae bacterium 4484_4]